MKAVKMSDLLLSLKLELSPLTSKFSTFGYFMALLRDQMCNIVHSELWPLLSVLEKCLHFVDRQVLLITTVTMHFCMRQKLQRKVCVFFFIPGVFYL